MNYNSLISLAQDNEQVNPATHQTKAYKHKTIDYEYVEDGDEPPFSQVLKKLSNENEALRRQWEAYRWEYKQFLDELKQRYPQAWAGMLRKKL